MKVACLHTELRPIEDLKPNPDNPNTHSPDQLQRLANVLKEHGWRQPIVVSNLSGYIVKGHGRLEAAKLAGFEKVPVEVQKYPSKAAEHADMVADNRLAELSQWDPLALGEMASSLRAADSPIELTGFTDEELDGLLEGLHMPDLQPTITTATVSPADLEAAQEDQGGPVASQQNGEDQPEHLELTCPHCTGTFKINRGNL